MWQSISVKSQETKFKAQFPFSAQFSLYCPDIFTNFNTAYDVSKENEFWSSILMADAYIS